MAVDPDEYAILREKFRRWVERQATRERRREWLRIVVAALPCAWVYWIIRILMRGAL